MVASDAVLVLLLGILWVLTAIFLPLQNFLLIQKKNNETFHIIFTDSGVLITTELYSLIQFLGGAAEKHTTELCLNPCIIL